jgi:hypothetical protein
VLNLAFCKAGTDCAAESDRVGSHSRLCHENSKFEFASFHR